MEVFTVYIIKSKKSGRYYVGYTGDLNDRIKKHNSGYSKATKSNIPWELVWKYPCTSKSLAIRIEGWIKSMKSALFIEKIIRGDIDIEIAFPGSSVG